MAPTPSGSRPRAAGPAGQGIPDVVAQRILRRIAVATGIPTLLAMAAFLVSYLLVSRQILAVPPIVTLVVTGVFFLLGLLGLSYAVLSASWEEVPGSLVGIEQVRLNLSRVRDAFRTRRPEASVGPER